MSKSQTQTSQLNVLSFMVLGCFGVARVVLSPCHSLCEIGAWVAGLRAQWPNFQKTYVNPKPTPVEAVAIISQE